MTTETTTLTDWLLARIAEDEADAQRIPTEDGYAHHTNCWDKDRVLAECEAKRRIVALHEVRDPQAARPVCDQDRLMGDADYPCLTLRALAAVYADHEGYREEWAL